MPRRAVPRLLAFAIASVLLPPPAAAQERIQIGTDAEVPLQPSTSVFLQENGSILARCQLAAGASSCTGLDVSGAGLGLTFSRVGSGDVPAGGSVSLTWSATGSPKLCYGRSTPAVAAWDGMKPATGSQSVTVQTGGTISFSLACYHETGSTGTRTVNASVTGGTTPPPGSGCTLQPGTYVKPSGYTERIVSWPAAFHATPYFTPTSWLHPIGSRTISDAAVDRNYISIPFVATNASNRLTWVEAQAIPLVGYLNGRPAHHIYVSISPCSGDFRLPKNSSTDSFERGGCRRGGQANQISWSASIATSSSATCAVVPGQQYFLNILFTDPSQSFWNGDASCNVGSQCEANFWPTAN